MFRYDILVIGGGASGMMAALTAAENAPDATVCLLEQQDRVGKKLLTTGNGRCNFSNRSGLKGRYAGDETFAAAAFAEFGVEQTVNRLAALGIPAVEREQGKLFPRSLQAGSVVDMLRLALEECPNLVCRTQASVTGLIPGKAGFTVELAEEKLAAGQVILAAGGKAGSKCTGGYALAGQAGHSVTPLYPAIVQLTTETAPIRGLTGIKAEGTVTARAAGKTRTESGEILFTEYGLSGPPVLQVSGLFRGGGGQVTLDLIPDLTKEAVAEQMEARRKAFAGRSCEHLLTGFMNKRLGQTVLKAAGAEKLSLPAGALSKDVIQKAAELCKAFPLTVTGTRGFANAQVTGGGVPVGELDPRTMASRVCPGLYITGEMIDVTGDCGGFNLQWAWTTGVLAGLAAAKGATEK